MALIGCPECGRQVSSSAAACPECAYPVATGTPAVPARAVTPAGEIGTATAGSTGLDVTKQILGRVLLGGMLFLGAASAELLPLVAVGAFVVWGSALPIWIRARRAEKGGVGRGRSGTVGRELEDRLEQRLAELEDRHLSQAAESEDRHQRQLSDLEERLDFTERLLTKQREQIGP